VCLQFKSITPEFGMAVCEYFLSIMDNDGILFHEFGTIPRFPSTHDRDELTSC
jgi:hypothetical protein